MAKSHKRSVILAALQPGFGTPAVPTIAHDAMLVRNITAKPVEANYVSRDLVRPFYGNSPQLTADVHAQLDFEVELAGSGTLGVAPAWRALIIPCYFAETITEGVSVAYSPVSFTPVPATIYYHLDGLLHQITDAIGTVSFDLTSKSIPIMKYSFMGTYNPVTDVALPTGVDFSKFKTPGVVNHTNTPAWSMHGYTGPLQAISVDIANALVWNEMVGYQRAEANDRKPTGKITMQLGTVADKDWWTTAKDALLGALSITQGTVAGNIVRLDAPQVQLSAPTYTDLDSKAMLDATLTVNPLNGDDELVVTCL